jgi:Uma2 family endonuclease
MATTLRERALQVRAFTVDEYHRMAEAGIRGEDERVELIEGRIVEMNPIGSAHAWCVNRLTWIFAGRPDVRVSVQNPVRLDRGSEPEPDLVVLRADAPQDRPLGPSDVLLVVEVADSSLGYDRQVKAPLYARAGIPELWIADLGGDRVEAHRTRRRPATGPSIFSCAANASHHSSRQTRRSRSTRSSAARIEP